MFMLKIAIIEDNAKYRQTLSIILQLDEPLQLIHKLHNCNDMLLRFTEDKPDVVLMDIDLPGISGDAIHAVEKGESAMNGMIASKVLGYFFEQ
jgi:DNA-binding NarL/FixJ family response regulator